MTTDDSFNEPLQVAVLGIGRIGSAFAFQLARTGKYRVTAIARPQSARLQQIERDHGILNTQGERADVVLADSLDEQISYDLVIVTLLAHQIDTVLPALQRSFAKRILFMFNTFEPERLRDAVGAQRSCFGMPFVQANFDQDGRLQATIGAARKTRIGSEDLVNVFIAAGLPAVFEPEMMLWLRCHAPLCIAFESVSVAAVRRGDAASWDEAMVLARGMKESFKLIRRLGYRLYPSEKRWLAIGPAWMAAYMLQKMSRIVGFRNLLATGINECRALVDVLVAAAAKSKTPVSVSKILAMKP